MGNMVIYLLETCNMEVINNLQRIIKPFMLRRTKEQELKDLPGKKEIFVEIGMTQL